MIFLHSHLLYSDITALAKDRAYAHINLNEMTIHQVIAAIFFPHPWTYLFPNVHTFLCASWISCGVRVPQTCQISDQLFILGMGRFKVIILRIISCGLVRGVLRFEVALLSVWRIFSLWHFLYMFIYFGGGDGLRCFGFREASRDVI